MTLYTSTKFMIRTPCVHLACTKQLIPVISKSDSYNCTLPRSYDVHRFQTPTQCLIDGKGLGFLYFGDIFQRLQSSLVNPTTLVLTMCKLVHTKPLIARTLLQQIIEPLKFNHRIIGFKITTAFCVYCMFLHVFYQTLYISGFYDFYDFYDSS